MYRSTFSFVLILILQISTNVLAEPNLTEDALDALDLLYGQIDSSAKLIGTTANNLWWIYTRDLPDIIEQLSRNETEKFELVLNNLTIFANNVAGGRDCIEPLIDRITIIINLSISEDLIFYNLVNLARVEVVNSQTQWRELNSELVENCIWNQINCEGTSKTVIAEVERLLPKVRRLPYELFADIHVLAYKITINLENSRTNLREEYNKGIQNAALCLATKIRASSKQNTSNTVINTTLSEAYQNLITVSQRASDISSDNLWSNVLMIATQHVRDIIDDVTVNYGGRWKANNTINALTEIARDLNVTISCSLPDIDTIFTLVETRIFNKTDQLVYIILERQIAKALNDISNTFDETDSIGQEIAGCSEGSECDYLLEKIAAKKFEIPWKIQQIENSTSVLFQQTVVAQREITARIIRDALEQVEISIVDLKSCIQRYLQQIDSN